MPKYHHGGTMVPQNIDLRDISYNINIFFGLIIAGFLIMLYDFNSSAVVSYSLIIFSVFMIFFITMSFSNSENMKLTTFQFVMNIISKGFPILLILFLLCWILVINIRFDKIISSGNLPREFGRYTTIVAGLFLLLMYLLKAFSSKFIDKADSKDKVARYSSLLITLIGVVTFWVLTIIQIMLEHYTTDG